MQTGSMGPYQWLTTADHFMGDFVRLCPEALLGRYLVVTGRATVYRLPRRIDAINDGPLPRPDLPAVG